MGVTVRNETRAVVVRNQPSTLGSYLLSDDVAATLLPLIAKGDKLERIAQICVLEARRNPALLECDPVSVVESVQRILTWGLEVGETAYLVPFGNKCQPVKGYQGLIQLMHDSGHVRSVEAHVVYAGDSFEYEYGLEQKLRHVPGNSKQRGPITHAYCIVRLPMHHHVFKVMSAEEIDAIRQQYSKQWKKGALPSWYAMKCAIIHTAKLLPKNSRFAGIHEAVKIEEAELVTPIDGYHGEQAGEDFPVEAAEDATPPKRVDADLAWAMGYVLPGNAKNWGGFGGKPLGEVTSKSGKWSILRQVLEWCDKDMDKPEHERRTYTPELCAAAEIVLEVRLAEQATTGELPLGDATPAPRNAIAEGR